jgi:small nuclear ribonucleoprotein (snRNP)-like protein
MLVELKNGDTYNGRLVSCDTWMNITLRDVICTSRVRGRREGGREEGEEGRVRRRKWAGTKA